MYIYTSPSFQTPQTHHHYSSNPKPNMALKAKDDQQVSVLQGNGICINRILARESSVGQSSRTFYRSAEGVPFRWEMQPGTPKNPQEDEDFIPPICPSPLMQSLGLPLPNLDGDGDGDDEPASKTSKIRRLREMVKKRINMNDILGRRRRRRSKQQESSVFSSPFSTTNRIVDVSMVHAPFCCTPWNTPAILDEGNTRIYYCSQHKNAFAVEEDDFFLSRILSGVSAAEHFSGPLHGEISPAGIPFGWEMHPGTPKAEPENQLIPPPSPPPAVQSLALPQPKAGAGREKAKNSALKKAWFWIRRYGKTKESKKIMQQHEISFRKMDEEFDACVGRSASFSSVSSIAPLSKGGWRVWKIRRDFEGRCGPWSRRDVLVFGRRKWKSSTS